MRFPPARLSTPTDASIDASETGALFQIAARSRFPPPIPSALTPLPSYPRSPLHDAAELGDVDAITAILNKEKNDGDFNPVRPDGALFFSRRSSDDPELGEKNPRSDPT